MRSSRFFIALIMGLALGALSSCTKIGPEKIWNNPHDPQGADWFPPTLTHKNDTIVAVSDTVRLGAEGHDANGSIAGFAWSFDHGVSWDTAWLPALQKHTWSKGETGPHPVYVRAIDNDYIASPPDSFSVSVHRYVPVLTKVRDTVVSQQALVTIKVNAFDTNSAITKYYWSDQQSGWTDSTSLPRKTFSQPLGGPLTVRWGVADNDTVVVDTFRILFNRGPAAAFLVEPNGASPAPFLSYNYVDQDGRITLSFSGIDPDGIADTLTYTLFLGASQNGLSPAVSGRSQSYIADSMQASTIYFWKLRAKDLFGDSIENSGSFTTAAAPGAPRGMKLVRSGSKSFVMGQAGFDASESPQHSVTFSYHFWMDTVEVTRKDYATILGLAPDQSPGADALPAANCTWYDAALYCNARSRMESRDTVYSYQAITGTKGNKCTLSGLAVNLDAGGYRLPTEAEWEYACRAGTQTLFFWGADRIDAETYAWLVDYSGNQTHPVAFKQPNAFGLYDMAGNVWEWCNDWFGTDYYSSSPSSDPAGPASGQERSIRGGSFLTTYYFAQSGTRSKIKPETSDASIGFRAVLINR